MQGVSTGTWTLTDASRTSTSRKQHSARSRSAARPGGYSVTKRTLRGGLREGVDVVEVDNGRFRFVVVPTRGMGIWRARLRRRCNSAGSRRSKGRSIPAFVRSGSPAASAGSTASTSCWSAAAWRATAPRSSCPTARSATPCTARSPTLPPTRSRWPSTATRAKSPSPAWSTRPGCSATSSA